jgi:fibronectin type 3 domain-containing protein
VQGGYTYYYRVSAVNSNGESPLSAEVSAYVPSPLPSPPTGVYATYDSSNNRNFITWNTVSGATSYRVYWGTSPGVTTGSNMLTPTTTPNYGHTGVQGGYTYYYRVTAVNSNGESPLSAEVSAYVPLALPSAPTGVSAVYQSSNNWNYITWNAVSGATSYRVYWGTSPGVTTGSNMLTPTTTTDYGHSGVVRGYTYYYRVTAVSSNGESPLSGEASAYVPLPLPSAPTGVYATYDSSNNRNFITWNTVSGAIFYRVYWGTSPGVTTGSNMLAPSTATNYGHTGVVPGYTYYYRVTAVNDSGESPLSAEVSAYVPLALPSAPTGVSAVYQSSNNWNYITWNAVSGATSYRVYWGTSPGVTTGSNMLTPTTTTDYGHSGVVRGYTYYYRVTAVNSNGESPLSAEVSAYVP